MVDQTKLEEEIKNHVQSLIAEDPTLFIVHLTLKGASGNQKLIVALDGDEGISIETCVSVSRRLSVFLEERDLIDGKYHLEVSSAGLDYPLQSLRQYKKNVGRSLAVTLADGEKVEGKLKEVDEQGVTLLFIEKKKENELKINFSEIDSSKVLVSFK